MSSWGGSPGSRSAARMARRWPRSGRWRSPIGGRRCRAGAPSHRRAPRRPLSEVARAEGKPRMRGSSTRRRPTWSRRSRRSWLAIRQSWKSCSREQHQPVASPFGSALKYLLRRGGALPPPARAARLAVRARPNPPAGHGARHAPASLRVDPRRGDEWEVLGDRDDRRLARGARAHCGSTSPRTPSAGPSA